MRNRGLIQCIQLSDLFFHRLLQCQDKLLRITIQTHLINDIKKQNEKRKNHQLNNVIILFQFPNLKKKKQTLTKNKIHLFRHYKIFFQ